MTWWQSFIHSIFQRSVQTVQFRLLAWHDRTLVDQYRRSIDFLDEEIRAKRAKPFHPHGLLSIDTVGDEDEQGTPAGAILNIIYLPDQITIREIQQYLRQLGATVEFIENS